MSENKQKKDENGPFLKKTWQVSNAIGKVFVDASCQMLINNLAIWSRWYYVFYYTLVWASNPHTWKTFRKICSVVELPIRTTAGKVPLAVNRDLGAINYKTIFATSHTSKRTCWLDFDTRLGTLNQCDQIELFLRGLGGKFSDKNRPNIWQLFWPL